MATKKPPVKKADPTMSTASAKPEDELVGKRDYRAVPVQASDSWTYETLDMPDGGIAQIQIVGDE